MWMASLYMQSRLNEMSERYRCWYFNVGGGDSRRIEKKDCCTQGGAVMSCAAQAGNFSATINARVEPYALFGNAWCRMWKTLRLHDWAIEGWMSAHITDANMTSPHVKHTIEMLESTFSPFNHDQFPYTTWYSTNNLSASWTTRRRMGEGNWGRHWPVLVV